MKPYSVFTLCSLFSVVSYMEEEIIGHDAKPNREPYRSSNRHRPISIRFLKSFQPVFQNHCPHGDRRIRFVGRNSMIIAWKY